MKTIQYTWSMAVSEVKEMGLNEGDEEQFTDAVNREIGESRTELENDEELPNGYQYINI
ncbi:MAG: hypothetical protein RPS47_17945 [Colwellia sp.]|jgi:hypothetical protein